MAGSSNTLRSVLKELGWSRTWLVAELRRQAAKSGDTLPGTESLIAMVSRWVNNHQQPSDLYRDLLARTLGRPPAELFRDEAARLELAAASLVILWRYLRGEGWREPWYAWTLVACATGVSVALNVAHAPERISAQLFAALPPVALLGALELLMSVARTGLPPTDRTPIAEDRSGDGDPTATAVVRPQLPAPDHRTTAGNGSGPQRDSRSRVRELVARERATGIRLHAREVAAAAGISERRAYELLRAARTQDTEAPAP
jgi:transcriptional regulator with XRE-family HTH domain